MVIFASALSAARAQNFGGGIRGTVTDPSSSVIRGASVTIKELATQNVRLVVSNTAGFYYAPNLTVGLYTITVHAPGFAEVQRAGIKVRIASENEVDFQLTISAADQTIVVPSRSADVDLATSKIGDVESGFVVRELPLNGRDWTTLAALQPNVLIIATENRPGLDVLRGNRGNGVMMSIGGARPQQTSYWLDGINMNDYSGGGPGSVLGLGIGVDAIEEFSVITANPSANYGMSSGGVINAVTREGTNEIHGSAYEFLRNSALDARNYFDGASIPPFKRNQFGGSLGGPIHRDRTFAFVNYEGIRQGLGVTTVDTVPSPNARAGRLVSGTVSVNSNVIPYLDFFPLPNGAIVGDTGAYSFSAQNNSMENFVTSHLTHHISDKDEIGGTYLFDTSKTQGPDTFHGVQLGILARRQTGSFEHTHTISASTANFLRFGFNRVITNQVRSLSAINPLAADSSFGFLPGRDVGEITIAGITQFPGGLGASGDYQFHFTSLQAYDDLSLVHGPHSIMTGASVEVIQSNGIGAGTNNGNVTFGSLASFLTNAPSSFVATIPGTNIGLGLRQWIVGSYMEDEWRILPNLTLNLGLRYETATVPSEQHNRLGTLDFGSQQLRQGSPIFLNPTFRNFSPRVGMAWDAFGDRKTIVRAAIGQYDSLPFTSLISLISVLSAPFTLQGSSASVAPGSFPGSLYEALAAGGPRAEFIERSPRRSYVLQWNTTIIQQLSSDLILEWGYSGAHGLHLPLIENDINTVAPSSVVGSNYYWPVPRGSGIRPWLKWGSVTAVMWQVSSVYDAFHAKLQKHFNHGLLAQASYTWSKSLDIGSNSLPTAYTNTVSNLPYFASRFLRSSSDFDVPHSLVVSGTWNLPSSEATHKPIFWLISNWQLGDLISIRSGLPFTTAIAGDPLGLNSSIPYDFPDRVNTNECQNPVNPGNALHYIRLSCFSAPAPSTRLGDAGRNVARGPGLAEWDSSLFKNIPIPKVSDAFLIQFRVEAFNILNHTNFEPPTSSSLQLFTQSLTPISSAGNLTATSTTSRQLQFGLKFTW